MNETSGRIIHIAEENKPIAGCTVSKQLYRQYDYSMFFFSMAAGTEISAESYQYPKIFIVYNGAVEVFTSDKQQWNLKEGEWLVLPQNIPVGTKTNNGCVYVEINFRKETIMNEILKAGEVFKLGELLPYQEGKIINMDLVSEEKIKFVLMSFDEGTGLSEHAAPGEALVFALDGEATIGYEGKEYTLHAGETFKFDKMGKHSVTAVKKFKMALMLILD